MPAFMPDGHAQAVSPCLLPLRSSFLFARRSIAGVRVAPVCRGLCHHCRARTKVGDRLRVRKNRQNEDFRPKSRKYATNLGQKHSKIGHVENIEKADVSCETMQNSPKTGQQDKTGCARLRLQKARLRAGVLRQKKERSGAG